MAFINWNGDGGGNDDPLNSPVDGGVVTAANQGVTDPTSRAGVDPNAFNTVSGYYQTLLGRAPENNDVVNSWVTGLGGGGSNLSAVQQAIANSPEAQAYKSRQTTTTPTTSGGGDLMSRIVAQLAYAKSSDDPNYWFQKISADPNGAGSAWEYWADRINRGNGAQLGLPLFQDGASSSASPYLQSGTNPGGYDDPSSQIYLNQLLQRLQQAQQPQDTQVYDMLKSLALQRVDALNAKPYSAADDAALITQYRQPLTQARDQAKQQAALDLSRRGIGPTSGVFQDRMKQIDQAYIGGVAQGANQMGVNAVAQKQQNASQQLQILSSLLAANNNQFDRSSAQGDAAVAIAKMFPDFDTSRLNSLIGASGDSSTSSALSALTSLGNLNLNTIGLNNSTDAANAAAWGKIIATLFGGLQ